jgi:hypothetical protein
MATRNRYAEIMANYAQSQPYSFFGYPQSYTGGYDATAYTPSAAPVNRYANIIAQGAAPMGGGGRGMPEAPSAWSQMTPAERAAYYAANPTEGKIALGMQDLFGNATLLGNAAKYFGADGWYDSRLEKQGYDPKQFAYGPPDLRGGTTSDGLGSPTLSAAYQAAIAAANEAGGGFTANPMSTDPAQQAAAIRQAEADSAAQRANEAAAAQASGGNGGGGHDWGGGGQTAATGGNNGDASGGGDRGTRGGFAQGGHVSMMHLQGPNPMGPDDGYGALKDGEYVINDKAVKKYGIELMNLINSGKISKGKLRGLLEM